MEPAPLLIEYLKEQYTQARQHETRQTAATTFLTSASAAVLALAVKDGQLIHGQWWLGVTVMCLGLANIGILSAHQIGNRFHTKLAGKVRHRLEELCDWNGGHTPTDLRKEALQEMNLYGPDVSIAGIVYDRLRWIPAVMIAAGLLITIVAGFFTS